MSGTLTCPHCQITLQATRVFTAGETVHCPTCTRGFVVSATVGPSSPDGGSQANTTHSGASGAANANSISSSPLYDPKTGAFLGSTLQPGQPQSQAPTAAYPAATDDGYSQPAPPTKSGGLIWILPLVLFAVMLTLGAGVGIGAYLSSPNDASVADATTSEAANSETARNETANSEAPSSQPPRPGTATSAASSDSTPAKAVTRDQPNKRPQRAPATSEPATAHGVEAAAATDPPDATTTVDIKASADAGANDSAEPSDSAAAADLQTPDHQRTIDEFVTFVQDGDFRDPSAVEVVRALKKTPVDPVRREDISKYLNDAVYESQGAFLTETILAIQVWGTDYNLPMLRDRLIDLEDPNWPHVANALGALSRDRKDATKLAEFLVDRERGADAANALQSMGPDSQPSMWPYLKSRDRTVVRRVCQVLAKVGNRDSLPKLEAIQQRDDVRNAAGAAIAEIQRRSR